MYFPIKFTSFDKKNIAIFTSRYEMKLMRDKYKMCMRTKLYCIELLKNIGMADSDGLFCLRKLKRYT